MVDDDFKKSKCPCLDCKKNTDPETFEFIIPKCAKNIMVYDGNHRPFWGSADIGKVTYEIYK